MFIKNILNISRLNKMIIIVLSDIFISLISTYFAIALRINKFFIFNEVNFYFFFIVPIIIYLPIFLKFELYNSISRFIGLETLKYLILAAFLYACIFTMVLLTSPVYIMPVTIGIIQPFIFFTLIIFFRILVLNIINQILKVKRSKNVLIYGIDKLAVKTAESLSYSEDFNLVGFLDPKNLNIGNTINGKKIYNFEKISNIIDSFRINTILITINKKKLKSSKNIIKIFEKHNLNVKYLPDIDKFINGDVSVNDFKGFDLIDLIDRNFTNDNDKNNKMFNEKTILITGAGGSIGSELCLQILSTNPKKIILIDHNEFSLYNIEKKLELEKKSKSINTELIYELSSIKDKVRINNIFFIHNIDFVYHAAAYKHVPLLEKNILGGIANNIFGSLNVIKASIENNIQEFVLISSDKAVRPTNIMGASKRIVEMIIQNYSNQIGKKKLKMSIVRFGNVLDSSGSVLPLFREQIKKRDPITVTHPEVTRYFMTISEAVNLIIQTHYLYKNNGEVFVLDMGKPIKILDLAKRVIKLSGLKEINIDNPDGDIEIKFIGLRPGEKLHEELFLGKNLVLTDNVKIYRANEETLDNYALEKLIGNLKIALNSNNSKIAKELLANHVAGFKSI